MIWPIFIPSKGRSNTQKTGALLKECGVPFYFVVEPQEANLYSKNGQILELQKNNMGLVFSRQSTLDYARSLKLKWFWMLDDDITQFYKSNGKKNVKTTAKQALFEAQMILSGIPNLGQGALEYQQYSWSSTKPLKMNGYCDVAVCINSEITTKCNFRKDIELKVDRDFTLQVLASGMRTARASQISFSAPKNGTNNGGLQSVYAKAGKEEQESIRMQQIWGNSICEPFTKPDGRKDVKINWSYFNK